MYDFKSITVVPSSKDFIDIILSKTQRKTPTVIHKHYKINRIREFYMRKVKFTQTNFNEKLETILKEFPRLEDMHPFYSDLINILYDKDHFKLALGQLNTVRQIIDKIGKDYSKLLKFGDSLYRCKNLKKAALGRMVNIMKKQKSNLEYLEQVRQHLSRLPSIDPTTRTIILCGFPNVGKSSFLNKMTRADVDVQPYPFTTKSLFVGHMDYKTLRWQVIDTPGLLDHPLDERNNIEMLAIAALAHLRAAVLYFVDLSEQCGHTLDQQIQLFESIKPLFTNKPLIVCANKVDVRKIEDLDEDDREMIRKHFDEKDIPMVQTSNLTEEGLIKVKTEACERLLTQRVETRMRTNAKKISEISNRLYIAEPVRRENTDRPAFQVPESIRKRRETVAAAKKAQTETDKLEEPVEIEFPLKMKTNRDEELELREEYVINLRKEWILANPEQRDDVIVEMVNGRNVIDYMDPDIEEKFKALEAEEKLREEAGFYDSDEIDDEDPDEMRRVRKTAQRIREKRRLRILASRERKAVRRAQLPRTGKSIDAMEVADSMDNLGVDISESVAPGAESHISRERGRSRTRALKRKAVTPDKRRLESIERSRSRSRLAGVKDEKMAVKVRRMSKSAQRPMQMRARRGEGDRHVPDLKPKHLFTGKRGIGKTDRR